MDPNIAIVAVVGENMRGTPGVAGRTFHWPRPGRRNIIAIAQGSSETNISFVVSMSRQTCSASHSPRIWPWRELEQPLNVSEVRR